MEEEAGWSGAEGAGPWAPAEGSSFAAGETAWTETLVDELAECVSTSWLSADDDMDGSARAHTMRHLDWGVYDEGRPRFSHRIWLEY